MPYQASAQLSCDNFVPSPTSCGLGECASTGVTICDPGTGIGDTCTPGSPSTEVCDNLDNDCDGSTDENLTRPTTCGLGECSGNIGGETCTAGVWGGDTCDPLARAIEEVCDGLDNDCDGSVDEGIASTPTTCGVGECASTGSTSCVSGTEQDSCVPGNPEGEGPSGDPSCRDNLDNDCDGLTDGSDFDCPVVPMCGDGFVDAGEECDDGNNNDGDGCSATCDVESEDNQPPVCDKASPSIMTAWPPNHKFIDVHVVGVTDPDGHPVMITIDGIYQDELVDERGDGKFAPDGMGVGSSNARVRVERDGRGNGRVYHITFTARDSENAECFGEVMVAIPHDQRGAPAVDGGALYDSTATIP